MMHLKINPQMILQLDFREYDNSEFKYCRKNWIFILCDILLYVAQPTLKLANLPQFKTKKKLSFMYKPGAINVPYSSCGLIRNLDKVDAKIFRLTPYIANVTDPAARIHMEVTCEAIADAGYDPFDMKGEKIGIFNATTCDDTYRSDTNNVNNVPTPFTFRTMNPNRTSFTLDFTGPSFTVDSACSSSGTALWCAVNSIKSGAIDAAVVSGCQLNLLPDAHAGFIKLGISTPTGNSRPFDVKSDGMIRTEAITAVFLQKAKVARRAYATVSAVRFYASGFNPEGISVTSETTMKRIMQDTLEEANIDQNEIEYVETHGTGTEIGDRNEVKTLCELFCSNRKRPLLIGTIKSNLGHTEASSGLCGIIKTLITFENDCIPPNIKYEKPRCPALFEGKVKVVTEPTPFNGKYIPISCVGFAGTFVQILLKKNPMRIENKPKASDLPRLVLYPATTEEAITTMLDYIQNNPDLPEEFFALLNKLSFTDPFLKSFRGYSLYQEGKAPISQIKTVLSAKRPVWFIMTGIGCQWPGMGLELMKINAFAESMHKSAVIMKTLGVDLFEILNEDGKNSAGVRNITSTIIGICSIQVTFNFRPFVSLNSVTSLLLGLLDILQIPKLAISMLRYVELLFANHYFII
ncbi:UNVERIFIED_CONTAM: Fatty acid synthase [Trichonephila clavipes]